MNRNHFKKNPNQDDLFDIGSQINDVKLLSDTSAMAGFTKETNSMLNKDIGSDTAEGVAEEREKERKYQAKMKMFDL